MFPNLNHFEIPTPNATVTAKDTLKLEHRHRIRAEIPIFLCNDNVIFLSFEWRQSHKKGERMFDDNEYLEPCSIQKTKRTFFCRDDKS